MTKLLHKSKFKNQRQVSMQVAFKEDNMSFCTLYLHSCKLHVDELCQLRDMKCSNNSDGSASDRPQGRTSEVWEP